PAGSWATAGRCSRRDARRRRHWCAAPAARRRSETDGCARPRRAWRARAASAATTRRAARWAPKTGCARTRRCRAPGCAPPDPAPAPRPRPVAALPRGSVDGDRPLLFLQGHGGLRGVHQRVAFAFEGSLSGQLDRVVAVLLEPRGERPHLGLALGEAEAGRD